MSGVGNNDNDRSASEGFDLEGLIPSHGNVDDAVDGRADDAIKDLGNSMNHFINGDHPQIDHNDGSKRSGTLDDPDELLETFNSTEGDWLVRCPSQEFLNRLNLTVPDFQCDLNFEFPDKILLNFTDSIPCPPKSQSKTCLTNRAWSCLGMMAILQKRSHARLMNSSNVST